MQGNENGRVVTIDDSQWGVTACLSYNYYDVFMTSLNENVAKLGPFQDVLNFFIDALVIVSFTNTTDCHDITKMLLTVPLHTILLNTYDTIH